MPFIDPKTLEPAGLAAHADLPTTFTPAVGETLSTAFQQSTSSGSFAQWAADAMLPPDVFERRNAAERAESGEVFDPFVHIRDTKYAEFPNSFTGADTPEQMYRAMARIDQELANQQTIEAAGGWGTAATMLAGLLDPMFLLIPAGAAAHGATVGARALASAVKTGAVGLAAMTANEAVLQATQETRPWQESAFNILAGGIMSAGAGALGPVLGASARKLLGREADMPPLDIAGARAAEEQQQAALAGGGSVGAARVQATSLEQESLKGAFGLERLAGVTSPMVRVLRSPLTESRRIVQDLVETPLFLQKHAEGIASEPAVETLVKMHDARKAQAVLAVDDAFITYRMGRAEKRFDRTRIFAEDVVGNTNKFTRLQFAEEIGKAMRRKDAHNIPEVAQAARDLRRMVFDPLKDEAIKLNLLPQNVQVATAASYLSRLWNTDRIVAQRDQFVATVKGWLATRPGALQAVPGSLEDMERSALANEITQSILSTPDGRLPYDLTYSSGPHNQAIGLRGPLQVRLFEIPDALVEPWLINDAERIAATYVRTLVPDLELVRRFGDVNMTRQKVEITEGYARLIAAATTEKERIALNKAMKTDIENLAAMRDILRGTYHLPRHPEGLAVRSFRVVRHWNYLRMLGGMALSSVTDLARPMMLHGLGNYFNHGLAPLIVDMKGVKLAAEEVKLAGTALDMVLSSRATILGDIMDDYGKGTKLERGLFWTTNKFGRLVFMSQWNAAMKQFAGIVSQSRMLDAVTMAQMVPKDVEWLAMLGLERNMATRIATQFRTYGESHDTGVRWANTQGWTDPEAVHAFRAALIKDVDRAIVTPGIGDKPLFANTDLGKVIFQFRSFTAASMTRTTLPALQQHDAAVLSGAISSVALGMLGYALYSMAAGRELSDDPKKWIADGLERSGLFSWLADGTQLAGKVTGYGVTSRNQSRNFYGALLGPTTGTFDDMTRILHASAQGDIKSGDITALRRVLPYNNVFYLRWLFNTAEQGIDEALGVPVNKH